MTAVVRCNELIKHGDKFIRGSATVFFVEDGDVRFLEDEKVAADYLYDMNYRLQSSVVGSFGKINFYLRNDCDEHISKDLV
jgi:hypothetical protein